MGFEVVVEKEVDEKEDEVDGILGSLVTVFLLVNEGLPASEPIPFLSESWVKESLRSSAVSCILDTPTAPVAPDILAVVPLKMGVPAPAEDDVLDVGVLPSGLEGDTPFPELSLIGYRLASHGNRSANEALTVLRVSPGFLLLLSRPFSTLFSFSLGCGLEGEVGSTALANSASGVL